MKQCAADCQDSLKIYVRVLDIFGKSSDKTVYQILDSIPLGKRPTVDFAFKKMFGDPNNRLSLIILFNAILELPSPIADVTIENPSNRPR